jgi:hypothetical protein
MPEGIGSPALCRVAQTRATRRQNGRTGGMKMKTQEKRFLVYNLTDGVLAYPELLTLAEARGLIWSFPNRFARQGYYLTASGERVRPELVEFDIVDAGADPPLGLHSAVQATHGGW